MKRLSISSLLSDNSNISKETIFIIKQISRGRYSIDSEQGILFLSLFLDNDKKEYIIILDEDNVENFLKTLINISIRYSEPSLELIKDYILKKISEIILVYQTV